VVADATGVDGSAHVPRTGLRPVLRLDFAAPSTPMSSAAGGVGMHESTDFFWELTVKIGCQQCSLKTVCVSNAF
jgi:hypothetical protein